MKKNTKKKTKKSVKSMNASAASLKKIMNSMEGSMKKMTTNSLNATQLKRVIGSKLGSKIGSNLGSKLGSSLSSKLGAGSWFGAKKNPLSSFIAGGLIVLVALIVVISSFSEKLNSNNLPDFFGTASDEQNIGPNDWPHDNLAKTMNDETNESMAGMMMGNMAMPANGRVAFKIDMFKKLATQLLEFKVFDEKGAALMPKDLQTVHEEKLHFFLVSADFRDYQHLHPYFENGTWKISAKLLYPGTYYAYTDFTPLHGSENVFFSKLTVQQATSGAVNYSGVTPNLTSTNRSFTAQLKIDQKSLGQASVLSYQLFTRLNTPVSALEKYLGEYGHIVILRQGDPQTFIHLHPVDAVKNGADDMNASKPAKGLLSFMATFGRPGRYTAFAQFNIGGLIYTFPITFDVTNF